MQGQRAGVQRKEEPTADATQDPGGVEVSQPGDPADRLIAHELTHTVQGQRQGVQRKEAEGAEGQGAGPEVSQPGDAAEVEADKVADGVADKLHGQDNKKDDKHQGADHAGEAANGKDANAGDHGPGGAQPEEKPAPISAKLEGVGAKVYAARGGAAPAPAANAQPAPQVNVGPIVGKLDQAITMFILWKTRGTSPVADQMLASLNTAKAGAQQLKGAQERNAPATELTPMKQHLSDQLQRIQKLDPNYELFSIGNMALTVKNVKKAMEPVAVQFTCGRQLVPLLGEYKQQLQMQQDGINAQTCQSWLNNRDQFLARQNAGGSGRSSVGTQMQAEYNRRSGSGVTTNTAAPHHSDQVAGGHADPTGAPVNADVNRSIGGQWPKKIETIDSKARAVPQLEQLFTQMNVQLTVQPT